MSGFLLLASGVYVSFWAGAWWATRRPRNDLDAKTIQQILIGTTLWFVAVAIVKGLA